MLLLLLTFKIVEISCLICALDQRMQELEENREGFLSLGPDQSGVLAAEVVDASAAVHFFARH